MTSFMQQLRVLARAHGLSVLVLNGTSAAAPRNPQSVFASTARKPALGPTFAFQTDATLWLARAPRELGAVAPNTHVAELLRARYMPSRTWCSFNIQNGVLRST